MSAGGSACGVVSSFGRKTCCACVSARRNRTGKDAGAGKTTTASENPAPPLSSSAVQWRAVPEKLRRPIENRWTLIKRTQLGTGAPTRATWPSTGAAGARCRLCGCASAAGGWGDDHHTAAARVLASTARGLWRRACQHARNAKHRIRRACPLKAWRYCNSVCLGRKT